MWCIETDSDDGLFVIRSGAFFFPEHGWRDNVPARLMDLANALAGIESAAESQAHVRVIFAVPRYVLDLRPDTDNRVHLTYNDLASGGMLLRERISIDTLRGELTGHMTMMINQMIQRRSLGAVVPLSTALERISNRRPR